MPSKSPSKAKTTKLNAQGLIVEKPFVEEEDLKSLKKIKIVDLFAGIGGFHYGIAASAARLNMGVKPILVSEIEPSCQLTYGVNHKC